MLILDMSRTIVTVIEQSLIDLVKWSKWPDYSPSFK